MLTFVSVGQLQSWPGSGRRCDYNLRCRKRSRIQQLTRIACLCRLPGVCAAGAPAAGPADPSGQEAVRERLQRAYGQHGQGVERGQGARSRRAAEQKRGDPQDDLAAEVRLPYQICKLLARPAQAAHSSTASATLVCGCPLHMCMLQAFSGMKTSPSERDSWFGSDTSHGFGVILIVPINRPHGTWRGLTTANPPAGPPALPSARRSSCGAGR